MVLDNKQVEKIIKSVTDKLGKSKKNKVPKITPAAASHVHGPDCSHGKAGQPISPPFAKK